jgi:hypothetical protein
MYLFSLVLAPLLQSISTFFWIDGEYGITGGTLLFFSMLFWIPALIFLFGMLKQRMPNYAEWGLLVAITGFISGVGFAFTGVFVQIFSISHAQYIREFSKYPLASNLLLFQTGPLAPLSLLLLGLVLIRAKILPLRIPLLLTIGALAFPVSRVIRIPWMAHIADLLFLLPLVELAIRCGKSNGRN